jgi:hypothetical protein
MDKRVLLRALKIMENQGKATLFGVDEGDDDDVRFVPHALLPVAVSTTLLYLPL